MKIIQPYYIIRSDIPQDEKWILKELEEDARTCYKSEDQITDDGKSAELLIQKLIDSGHEAMLEGWHLKVKFICDRGVSHELVRHRLASFSQESTRYCNYSKGKFGNEITVIEPVIFKEMDAGVKQYLRSKAESLDISANEQNLEPLQRLYTKWVGAMIDDEWAYMGMLEDGATPEIARAVLPTCLKTEINMTANIREWRHVLKERTSGRAHPEMRRLMLPLLSELHTNIPLLFDDIWSGALGKTCD